MSVCACGCVYVPACVRTYVIVCENAVRMCIFVPVSFLVCFVCVCVLRMYVSVAVGVYAVCASTCVHVYKCVCVWMPL